VVTICGILGVCISKNSREIIKNLYEIFLYQKDRGMQGAGISIANGGELFRFRSLSPFRLSNVYNYDVWARLGDGCRALVHHRYPTSTINRPCFNHPIANEDNSIHLIHNGMIMNHKELYNKLKLRHTFETKVDKKDEYTDSEVLIHLFEDKYKGKPENIVKALEYVFNKTSGIFAVALQIKGDKNIYLIRHTYPIVISKDNEDNYYFSSEFDKDNKNLKKIYELQEGEIGMLDFQGYKKLSMIISEKVDEVMDYSDLNSYMYGYSDKINWQGHDKYPNDRKKWGKRK